MLLIDKFLRALAIRRIEIGSVGSRLGSVKLHARAGSIAVRLRSWWPLPALLAIGLPALWPLMVDELPRTADGKLHLLRLVLLDNSLHHGVPYPRWFTELMTGYGFPVFNFYAPGSYYLAELLHLLGLGYYQAMAAAYAALILIAGFGMLLLAGDLFGSRRTPAALVAAAAYTYAPYFLTNAYMRGAIAEVGAQALLPWVLWSLRRVFHAGQPSRYAPILATLLAALVLTHTLMLVVAPPVLLAYFIFLWVRTGRQAATFRWGAVGIVTAVALSAFFWAPAALQRSYLSDYGFKIAREVFLPENVWTWHSFIDTGIRHIYSLAIPFRLGLAQLALALVGAVFARRRDGEWLFLIALAILCGLGIGKFTLPVWLSNPVLVAVQFPWRLLSVMSVPLALLTAGIVARPRSRAWQMGIGLVAVGVLVAANRPVLPPLQTQPADNAALTVPAIAQWEANNSNQWGTTSTREFLPEWVDLDGGLAADPPFASLRSAALTDVSVQNAGPYQLTVDVNSQEAGPLRLATFFFPGWQATLDGNRRLASYPSTNLGLLTVDIPAGQHRLHLSWMGEPVVPLSGVLSVVALVWLAWCGWRWGANRWTAFLPALVLVVVAASALLPAGISTAQSTVAVLSQDGLKLSGYRWEEAEAGEALYVYPYWYVQQTPRNDWALEWELQNSAQERVASVTARPYFRSQKTTDWPAATLVDDAYRLPLPPTLPPGTYRLLMKFVDLRGGSAPDDTFAEVGDVRLAATPPRPPDQVPQHALDLRFGDALALTGYDMRTAGSEMATGKPDVVSVSPGSVVTYGLAWRATRSVLDNYHGFVHLADGSGQVLTGMDQLPGDELQTPILWDPYSIYWDRYLLQIPLGAQNGLYWPRIGLYSMPDVDLVAVSDHAGARLGDSYLLPPIKVMGRVPLSPQHPLEARFGDMATLLGYDVAIPERGLRSGSQLRVTLYYRSDRPVSVAYTRFVHLANAQLGIAQQQDGSPQGGNNPTWAWVRGEVIRDEVELVLPDGVQPGSYILSIGFYDRLKDGVRLAATTRTGDRLANDEVNLEEATIYAR